MDGQDVAQTYLPQVRQIKPTDSLSRVCQRIRHRILFAVLGRIWECANADAVQHNENDAIDAVHARLLEFHKPILSHSERPCKLHSDHGCPRSILPSGVPGKNVL